MYSTYLMTNLRFQAQLLEDQQKQLDNVKKSHETEIQELKDSHATEMADVNANHQTQIDKLKEIQALSSVNTNGHNHNESDIDQIKVCNSIGQVHLHHVFLPVAEIFKIMCNINVYHFRP